METCNICRFEMTLDDVAIVSVTGHAMCLRCYTRLTDTQRRVPRRLRLEIEACMQELAA